MSKLKNIRVLIISFCLIAITGGSSVGQGIVIGKILEAHKQDFKERTSKVSLFEENLGEINIDENDFEYELFFKTKSCFRLNFKLPVLNAELSFNQFILLSEVLFETDNSPPF